MHLLIALVACTPTTPTTDPPPAPSPTPPVLAPTSPAQVRFDLSFAEADRNRLVVTATAEQGCGTWWMSTWIPGSYLIREFARNVESVSASAADGPVPVTKVAKDAWHVDCEQGPVELSYTVAARELSVRTSYVDHAGAVLNPPSWAILPDGASGPFQVVVQPRWDTTVSLLGDGPSFTAPDVDTLMDAPMLSGSVSTHRFEVDGVPHEVLTLDPHQLWTHPRIGTDVAAIVKVQRDFWGDLPYERYRVLNALGGRGGLEHMEGTLLLAEPFVAQMDADGEPRDGDAYRSWLSVVSHELFHVWNVKRMRPAGLVPLDYRQELYTPDLWVAEGLTAYYDNLLLARAGLMDEEQLLAAFSKELKATVQTPGAQVQSLSQASTDAWVEFYRHDEHSVNQGISYYRKGAVVGFILDVHIRRATNNQKTLDDAMRAAWARFGPGGPDHATGYTPEGFRQVISETAGRDLEPLIAEMVDGTGPLPIDDALAFLGLMRLPIDADEVSALHGAEISDNLHVTAVRRGTPAWDAGVMPGDELVGADGWRLTGTSMLDAMPAGEHTWTLARQGRLLERTVSTTQVAPEPWEVVVDPTASRGAARLRTSWASSGG